MNLSLSSLGATFPRPVFHSDFSPTHIESGFPGGSDDKEFACNAGDLGSIPGLGRSPGDGNGLPTPVFWLGELHGQRSLADYSPWGCKESKTTEQLSRAQCIESGCQVQYWMPWAYIQKKTLIWKEICSYWGFTGGANGKQPSCPCRGGKETLSLVLG